MAEQEKDPRAIAAERALNEDITQVRDAHNIDVAYSISVRGGPSLYRLTDLADGKVVGTVELRRSDYFPGHDKWLYHQGELQGKLGEMLETPMDQLKRLVESDVILYEDIKNLEGELGVHCYKPNALPLEERIPGGERQILYATTEFFDGNFFSSSEAIGIVPVNVSEYVPGRHDYSEQGMYQQGELRQALTQDSKLFLAYVGRVLHNAQHAQPDRSFAKIDWAEKAANLTTDFAI